VLPTNYYEATCHALFGDIYLCVRLAFHVRSYGSNWKSLAQMVLQVCWIVCANISESRDLGHARFGESYLIARSASSRRSFVPNLRSLAEVLLKICLIVCHIHFKGSRNISHARLGEYFA